jgi:signal transduction histidine kinase
VRVAISVRRAGRAAAKRARRIAREERKLQPLPIEAVFDAHPKPAVWVPLVVATIALIAVSTPTNSLIYGVPFLVAFPLAILQAGSIPLALLRPRTAIVISLIPAVALPLVATLLTGPWPWPVTGIIAQSILVFVITLRGRWTVGIVAWALGVAAGLLVSNAHPEMLHSSITDVVVFASVSGGAFALALVLGQTFAQLIAQRESVRAQLMREKQISAAESTRRELVEERNRIARELHDVVAHGMSVIHVQATTARYRLSGLDDATIAEFSEIAASARTSLAEMRRLLGVLRDEETTREFAPQPGLDDIPRLVGSAERAGVTVQFTITEQVKASAVPQTTALAAFRIVQEALSNVIRHAPDAAARVRIDREADDLVVSVENEPAPGTSSPPRTTFGASDSGGHGLVGIRERAALLGGRTQIGVTSSGGYRVEARLPIDAVPPAMPTTDFTPEEQ